MKLSNHIEAILFLAGEPMKISRLAKLLEKTEVEVKTSVDELEKELENQGLRVLRKEGEIMLGTASESSKYCEALVKEELDKNLGKAGLEILAIILYKGVFKKDGVTRTDIDNIRGVNSSFTLRNLLIKGLVERNVNPKDKRSFVYSPSMKLVQYLGIVKQEDLPDFENIKQKLENACKPDENI